MATARLTPRLELDHADSESVSPQITATADIPGFTLTFTLEVAGPVVFTFDGNLFPSTGGNVLLYITDLDNNEIAVASWLLSAAGNNRRHWAPRVDLPAGEHAVKLRGQKQGGGYFVINATPNSRARLTVEQI